MAETLSCNVNDKLAELFVAHGISVQQDEEFIYPDLPVTAKIKAQCFYHEVNNYVSSQLDVWVITSDEQTITESFGDFGDNLGDAINRNFQNFSMSSFHVLLAAFGHDGPSVIDSINLETWEIAGKKWTAYIGNIVPKSMGDVPEITDQISSFFTIIETAITSTTLNSKLHWCRGFYSQYQQEINTAEFFIDNYEITDISKQFYAIPLVPEIQFLSFRIFIILKLEVYP